jgi:capsid protein
MPDNLDTVVEEAVALQTQLWSRHSRLIKEELEILDKVVDYRDEMEGWDPISFAGSEGTSIGIAYRNESELAKIRNEGRQLVLLNEFAINAIENRISYVVGTGHNYKVSARKGIEIVPDVLEHVMAVIDRFTVANRWHARQQEIVRRKDRDGEVFLRFFEDVDTLRVRFVEPEQIGSPPGRTVPYGLVTAGNDAETIDAYWVKTIGSAGNWEEVPAAEMQHRKVNVDLGDPRGIPTFYPVRKNLQRASKILRNMSTVAEIQSAIAMVRRHIQGSQATIQQYVSQMADAKATSPVSGVERTYKRYPPGTILDTTAATEYDFPASGIDISRYVAALQAELRAVASRLVMPEFMLSSDASNANYSSTLVAEGPAVKMFERLQADTIWQDLEVVGRAIRLAETRGELPAGTSEQITIDADGPIVQSRDRLKDAQADQILLTSRVMSRQTMASRHGLEYQQEHELINGETDQELGY